MQLYTAKVKNGREVIGQHINLNGVDYIVPDTTLSSTNITGMIRIWGAYEIEPETLRRIDDKC